MNASKLWVRALSWHLPTPDSEKRGHRGSSGHILRCAAVTQLPHYTLGCNQRDHWSLWWRCELPPPPLDAVAISACGIGAKLRLISVFEIRLNGGLTHFVAPEVRPATITG